METAFLGMATMGFIFGLAAFSQVTQLKKEVERLNSQLEGPLNQSGDA